jgi:UDP-N-acetylglucosamine 4,6-dehydratase/5-epimerase
MNLLAGRTVVVTGGSGSFGHAFVRRLLSMDPGPLRVCILSRDEYKQGVMRAEFRDDHRLRWFLGDVRNLERLKAAFHGAYLVVHAAALKQVPACEYNVHECVDTNIVGSQNVVRAAVECGVSRVIALSTDKACSPCTSYGTAKLMMERVVVNANSMAGGHAPWFSCTRYGNIQGSRLSVVPVWRDAQARGEAISVTHPDATRFHMTQEEAVDLVLLAANRMRGGEVFIPKLPAYRLGDLAEAVVPGWTKQVVGLRVGEKMHESLIAPDEVRLTRDMGDHFCVLPAIHPWRGGNGDGGEALPEDFAYRSDTVRMLTVEELREAVSA